MQTDRLMYIMEYMKWVVPILFLMITPILHAQEFNAGFVEGLWYDHETVFADEPTRVYVAIRNNTGADLTGTVEFFVDDTRIERTNVSAINGHIITSWADWTPSYGEHTISATLSRIELHKVGSSTEAVTITSALAEDSIFVDYDTDKDGTGNKEDEDDDGDGITDTQEKKDGTDPLDPKDPAPEPEPENEEETTGEETEETEGEDSDESKKDGSSSHPTDRSANGPEGLEQYLTESRADTALTSLTQSINTTKKRIDDYRDTRNQSLRETTQTMDEIVEAVEEEDNVEATTTDAVKTNESGFGEVTTSKNKDVGLLVKLLEAVRQLIALLYTFMLFLVSVYLGHPVIVQLTLLFLILFIIFKLAKRLGQRPQ